MACVNLGERIEAFGDRSGLEKVRQQIRGSAFKAELAREAFIERMGDRRVKNLSGRRA
jgi:hypothetical protein